MSSRSLTALACGAVLTFSCGTPPSETSDLRSEMDDVSHHIEEVATPDDVADVLKDLPKITPSGIKRDGLSLATIVNTAKETWKFIADNEAVSNISYDYANALPDGAETADLAGFSDLQTRSYRVFGKNLFGITVYDVTYTLVHQYGGNVDGKGRYLATVSVIPSNVSVLWGYTTDFHVSNVSVTNVGTRNDPVASLSMELSFKVSTILKKHTETYLFQFRGDSANVRSH